MYIIYSTIKENFYIYCKVIFDDWIKIIRYNF